MSKYKKIILIIVLLIVAFIIGLIMYFLFFVGHLPTIFQPSATVVTSTGGLPTAGTRTTTAVGGETTTTAILPTAGTLSQIGSVPSYYVAPGVTQISTDYVTHPSLSQSGAFRYYNEIDGKFYKINSDGTISELVDKVFYNASNVTWAKTNDKAVIEYPDGKKIVYNFETKKQITLPDHWEDFSFSADSNYIAAKSVTLAPENRWLVTTKDDGTSIKRIEPMGRNQDEVIVNWSPSQQTVAFSKTGEAVGADRREIYLVGQNKENFKSLIVEGFGFEPQWSTTGKKLLYSVYSTRTNYKPELWVVDSYGDSIGNNRQALYLNTWADKCAFSGDTTLYCAVPKTLPTGAGMVRGVADSSYDDLYKIDVGTGLKTPITLKDDYNIKNISYDATNGKLFFTDNNKTGIFELKI
jgi:hypothetical protein